MTTVRQILRCAKRLGQLPESGARAFNLSARCASIQAQQKVVENENGKRIFSSPYGEYTFNPMYTHEYVWRNVSNYADKLALVRARSYFR